MRLIFQFFDIIKRNGILTWNWRRKSIKMIFEMSLILQLNIGKKNLFFSEWIHSKSHQTESFQKNYSNIGFQHFCNLRWTKMRIKTFETKYQLKLKDISIFWQLRMTEVNQQINSGQKKLWKFKIKFSWFFLAKMARKNSERWIY